MASDTAPVREVIKHNETGLLVDFFDVNAIAGQVTYLLNNPVEKYRVGEMARGLILQKYDLEKMCLPKQKLWVKVALG